jgi:hypothetical protein
LFTPFRWASWWRLALLGLATGEAASNGGCNFNGLGDLSKIGQAGKNAPHNDFAPAAHVPPIPEGAIALIVTTLIIGIIVLVFVHLYVSSVARFMLFDAVATGRQRLREGWKRWHSHGFRYFLFQLLMIVISLTVFGVVIIIPALVAWKAGVFSDFQAHWGFFAMEMVIVVPILVVVAVTFAVFELFFKDFVIPVMGLEAISIADAIRKVWSMVRNKKGDFTIYVLMKIVLAIVIGIAMAIIIAIFSLVVIVPVIIAFLVGAGVGSPQMFESPFTIAVLVTLGLLALIPFIFVIGLIATPAVVFYQSYVLNFFGSRYAPLWVFMHPEGLPSTTPPAAPLPGGHEPPPYDIVPPEPTG